ncbi:chromosomal replication initiator protein DnaA2 (plasmid) [Butyrivibrio proteoclasticus B316]|uniref:Chromosomal replication initiator protein DnaA2 n=1 Tax=Butyrivibrio proteoclasticus (strain ATCC 51982 / DSM 14932 / B316) TaxID=515622 RepID=E0S509_BUTPB|nr:DnaA/Hda family protein [Butyrivibrio proteoclasticus]ADL36491.1 chromosomal replication initiator protein DnaA2 [Butyrivibrio proteoclasticus B316]
MGEPKRGVFWLVDNSILAFPFEADATVGVAKSGKNYNHKLLWDFVKPKECSNKPFYYYPRGRVEFNSKGKPILYMNCNIGEEYIPKIMECFGLTELPQVHYDGSSHYMSYLEKQEWQIMDKYSFLNFRVSSGNYFAFQAAQLIIDPRKESYNPLYIYGDHGSGKTHLLKTIEDYINHESDDKRAFYILAEKFINDVMDMKTNGNSNKFVDFYRSLDVLLIDDIDCFVGKSEASSELVNIIDVMLNDEKQLVFSSQKEPRKLGIEEALISRIEKGLLARIEF